MNTDTATCIKSQNHYMELKKKIDMKEYIQYSSIYIKRPMIEIINCFWDLGKGLTKRDTEELYRIIDMF